MAPKRTATPSTGTSHATASQSSSSSASAASTKVKSLASGSSSSDMVQKIRSYYLKNTSPRTKLIDVFLAFLVVVGALQFLYCILAGNYPFNAFLSGFCGTVGQFVLTASLRVQTQEANKKDFPAVSPERAFADYVVCSLILHFFCVNFIN